MPREAPRPAPHSSRALSTSWDTKRFLFYAGTCGLRPKSSCLSLSATSNPSRSSKAEPGSSPVSLHSVFSSLCPDSRMQTSPNKWGCLSHPGQDPGPPGYTPDSGFLSQEKKTRVGSLEKWPQSAGVTLTWPVKPTHSPRLQPGLGRGGHFRGQLSPGSHQLFPGWALGCGILRPPYLSTGRHPGCPTTQKHSICFYRGLPENPEIEGTLKKQKTKKLNSQQFPNSPVSPNVLFLF